MKNENQHIKNFFFLFLEKKENRPIPATFKYYYFPEKLTPMEAQGLDHLFHGKSNQIISLRTNFINDHFNTDFEQIFEFDTYAKDIALATYVNMFSNMDDIFINKRGEPDVTGISNLFYEDFDRNTSDYLRYVYNNTIKAIKRRNGQQ